MPAAAGSSSAAPTTTATPPPSSDDRHAKSELRASARAAARATGGSSATAPSSSLAAAAAAAVSMSKAGSSTASGQPAAPVSLVINVDGVPQQLSPVEYEMNTQKELISSPSVAVPSAAVPPAAGGARRKAPAIRKAPALSVAKAAGKSKGRGAGGRFGMPTHAAGSASPATGSEKRPTSATGAAKAMEAAFPPTSTAQMSYSASDSAAAGAPAAAAAAATLSQMQTAVESAVTAGVQPLMVIVTQLATAVSKMQDDVKVLSNAIMTQGLSQVEVRKALAKLEEKLGAGVETLLEKAEEAGAPAVKDEKIDSDGHRQIERVRARLRAKLATTLGAANKSSDALPDKETYRDLVLLEVQDELNTDEVEGQVWLSTAITVPSRGSGDEPLTARPLVPLLRVRAHFLQALKKRVLQAFFTAIGVSPLTMTVSTAIEWKEEDKYIKSSIGRKALVSATSAALVSVGAGWRVIQPTKVGDEPVVETTLAVVSLVATFVRAALDDAANTAGTHGVGDNLTEKIAAEQARIEQNWKMDKNVQHGIRLID